jgi:hypothetical protein
VSVWDLRMQIEQAMPWYAPLIPVAIAFIYILLFEGTHD